MEIRDEAKRHLVSCFDFLLEERGLDSLDYDERCDVEAIIDFIFDGMLTEIVLRLQIEIEDE
jgi:hypothetical protein